ncbi:protein of unknown function [Enterobacter cancerogenus]|nr:protein of unknown function [Enterobacter cancerogenus]
MSKPVGLGRIISLGYSTQQLELTKFLLGEI